MSNGPWLLCPSAHEEAKRTGLVYRCGNRRDHVCDGPRTPHLWDARGPHGEPFKSEQPCCGSCISDEEFNAENGGLLRDLDDECCCVHGSEYRDWHAAGRAPVTKGAP